MGIPSCVSVVVICQGGCDLSLREPENITVFIFNGSCLLFCFVVVFFLYRGLWFYFLFLSKLK